MVAKLPYSQNVIGLVMADSNVRKVAATTVTKGIDVSTSSHKATEGAAVTYAGKRCSSHASPRLAIQLTAVAKPMHNDRSLMG